jgi:deoxycytidine triphosphate deaminase
LTFLGFKFLILLMLLGVHKLLKLVKQKNLVTGLTKRELENPEGAGFDLSLGEVYEIIGSGFLGVEERETPKLKLVAKLEKETSKSYCSIPTKNRERTSRSARRIKFILLPQTYYVVKTVEKVNLPLNLAATFRPRSTLYRSGIGVFSGNVAPGYRGEINVGICNFTKYPFEIELGARFLHIMFWQVKGKVNAYRGQWQGGRTTTKKREKQV